MASFNPSNSQVDGDKGSQSFWTFCPLCHYVHEYIKKYENFDLLCQTCRRPFRAMAMASAPPLVPGTESYYYWVFGYGGYPGTVSRSPDISQNMGFPWTPFFSPSHHTMTPSSSAHMFSSEQQKPSSAPSQECDTPLSTPNKNGDSSHELLSRSKLGIKSNGSDGVSDHKANVGALKTELRVTRSRSSPVENRLKDRKMASSTQASPTQGNVARNARNLLEKKAKMEILKNLSEHPNTEESSLFNNNTAGATTTPSSSQTRKTINHKVEPKVQSSKHSKSRKSSKGSKKRTNSATKEKKKESEMIQETCKDIATVEEVEEQLDTSFSVEVPDSDFYNFDDDRTEERFEEGHIWAVYDEEDGMPRIYARIQKVISHTPFSVKLSWLQSVTGTKRSCGRFRTITVTTTDVLNLFSHKMFCNISPSGGDITIYPKENEVWVIHDRSSAADRENTSRYQIVEILHDFTEADGVALASLVKVFGFKSVYQRMQTGLETFSAAWSLSMNDLQNFSHQIPARKVEEYVAYMPDNCWELDPAAIPDCLLKGFTE